MSFYKKFSNIRNNVTNWIYLRRLSRASNASFKISKVTSNYPLQLKFKKLLLSKKWQAGRGSTGRILVYSKSSRIKKRLPFINYSYRRSCLFFIAGLNYTSFKNKFASLIINSQGEVSYLPTAINNNFFMLNRFKPVLWKQGYPALFKEIKVIKPFIHITELPYMLIQQKKNSPINHIEQYPLIGSQYTRSFGSKSSIIKLDTRTGLSIVKLSSGLKKVFSAFSLANEGHSNIKILKNRLVDTKSGNWRRHGSKSKVRGVAKNPVDHPHGGRTNSIKYPRTPWGKTTKFK